MLPKPSHIARGIILLAFMLIIPASAGATDLSGKVIEVIDGNTISLKSLSHTIKVRLVAVAPPAAGQPYADVARKHLSDLILEKYVVVRYTAIGEQGYLVGRILLEQGDINAQMLRDGVAWYYQAEARELSQNDRALYPACENAARSERRGLWQDPSPTSPWDFKKAQTVIPTVSATAGVSEAKPRARTAGPAQLSSDDLLRGVTGPGSTGQPNVRRLSLNATPGSWINYQPADQHFSILAPSDAVELARPMFDEAGNETTFHYVVGTRGEVFCSVMWTEGPNNKYTDASVVTEAMQTMVKGLNREIARKGGNLSITSKEVGTIRKGDYAGKEYSLNVGEVLGLVRVLSRQVKDKRELLVLTVMNRTADEASVNQFLNSLKFNAPPETSEVSRPRTTNQRQ